MQGFSYHYLDNSATTNVCREAVEKAAAMMTECFGNPSSLHTLGFEAEKELVKARHTVAAWLGANRDEIVFTSGGTEANNLALRGCAHALSRRGKHIVTTAVEHPSVASVMTDLEKEGFTVTRLFPNADGIVTAAQVEQVCRPDTILVSVMLVNNETGARFPVEAIAKTAHRLSPLAKVHTDAVQAVGKLAVRVDKLGVDMLTMSGHKIHAPKGSGALYVKKGCRLCPLVAGGGQERGLRSGTEALPAIAGMAASIEALPMPSVQTAHYERLCDRLTAGLAAIPDAVIHRPAPAVPYILNVSLRGLRSETVLHLLAQRNVYVSSGSACSRGQKSSVLTAMGLSDADVDSAIRISFSRYTDESDIDALLSGLTAAAEMLKRRV